MMGEIGETGCAMRRLEGVGWDLWRSPDSLYFPSQLSCSVFNTFAKPVGAFLAMQCLTTEGALKPLEEIPQLCARLQFSIRLHRYHYLYTNYTAAYVPSVKIFGFVSHFFIDW